MQKNIEKNLFIFEKIASELVELSCLYYADTACHRQSIC